MVHAMMRCPPQRSLLQCHSPTQCHQELGESSHFIRPVRKITVVSCRDEEHAAVIQSNTKQNIASGEVYEKNGDGAKV